MVLQPYSHYYFSKISRTLFDFLNNTYWVSFFQRNNLLIFWTGVSCFSVTLFFFTLFCCGGKANLVRLTLFYSTLLTLTDRQNYGGMNTLAAGGLEEPFFQLCCCVSFLFWWEIEFGFTYYLCTQSTIQLWCCVSFFGTSRKQFLVLRAYLVYNTVVRLCQFFCCGGKVNFVRIPYSHDRLSKISRTFFVKKMIPYKIYVQENQLFLALYGSTTIQSLLFLKNIENFV